MDRLERFYRLHHLFEAGKCLRLADLMHEFEVSKATMKRDIEYMRDRLNAPLIYDRDREGYRYDLTITGADRYELPGVWFSPAEVHALLVVHNLLSTISPQMLAGSVTPLISRIEKLLEDHRLPSAEVGRRIRILNVAHRDSLPAHFALAAQAVLQRQRLKVEHWHRKDDRTTTRELSPQRLIHYRGTWYLDAWCHLREGLRSFSLDALSHVAVVDGDVKDVPEDALERFFASSYGIFTGTASHTAVLRFSAERARWVKNERWHPEQVGVEEPDGRYRLEFPYGDGTELVMDILRHGAHVEVLGPDVLRAAVASEAREAAAQYAR